MGKERFFNRVMLMLAAVSMTVLWSVSAGAAEGKSGRCPAPPPTLYERVGGINNIAVLIDEVIERSYVNDVFNENPRIVEAHKRYPKAAYKYNATALACMVMGGPQKYTGRTLKDAHQHLMITEVEWDELIKIFRESMDKFQVPHREQKEILDIIESTKCDILYEP